MREGIGVTVPQGVPTFFITFFDMEDFCMTRATIYLMTLIVLALPSLAFADLGSDLLLLTSDFTQTGTDVWQGSWADASGNGHNVYLGYAASYDGSADPLGGTNRSTAVDMTSSLLRMRVDGGNDDFNPGTEDYSVSYWYYQTDSTDYQHIVSLGNTYSATPGYSLHAYNGQPNLRFQDVGGDTSTRKTVASGVGDISANGWHHVVAVFDRTGAQSAANTVSLYVDTWLMNSTTIDSTYDISSTLEWTLGGTTATKNYYYKGYLDDVAIYQGALSTTDVSTLYMANAVDSSTITTAGVTPIMIQNFETDLSVGFDGGLETTTDATNTYTATGVGDLLTVVNDAQRGEVVLFPGMTDNHVSFGDPGDSTDDLDIGTGDYTVSFWFNTKDTTEVQMLAVKGNLASSNAGWSVFMENDGLSVRAASAAGDRHQLATNGITENEWHHVVMVVDNQNGLLKAYYDGQSSEATENNIWNAGYDGKAFTAGSDFSTDDPLILGERVSASGSTGGAFAGMLDDFAVWDRALTEAEILDIYAGVTIPITPDWAPGDANKDGRVDGSDVTILAGNWQKGVDDGLTASWEEGDFNGDGKVDGSDVTILAGNWQYGVEAAASAVPEPSTLLLLLAGMAGLFVMRRR